MEKHRDLLCPVQQEKGRAHSKGGAYEACEEALPAHLDPGPENYRGRQASAQLMAGLSLLERGIVGIVPHQVIKAAIFSATCLIASMSPFLSSHVVMGSSAPPLGRGIRWR